MKNLRERFWYGVGQDAAYQVCDLSLTTSTENITHQVAEVFGIENQVVLVKISNTVAFLNYFPNSIREQYYFRESE